jgi:predicted acetyltransferase
MRVEVEETKLSKRDVISNLLELYTHDLSDIFDVELGDYGRFGYPYLNDYWQDPNRYPFLIVVDGKIAGFILLIKQVLEQEVKQSRFEIAEFFVLRGFRRRGVGRKAAYMVWDRFASSWRVRVLQTNVGAMRFWEKVILAYTGGRCYRSEYRETESVWEVFEFQSNAA